MRIQPIDSIRSDVVKPPVKSRLKRLFDRPFNGVLKISSAEKPVGGGEKDGVATATVAEFEPSSVCLDKMVQNFIEDNNEKQSTTAAAKCGRNRCNCFNGNSNDSSDDELDFFSDSVSANSSFSDPSDTLKVRNFHFCFFCFSWSYVLLFWFNVFWLILWFGCFECRVWYRARVWRREIY